MKRRLSVTKKKNPDKIELYTKEDPEKQKKVKKKGKP